jgi:CheY-like chemotaxis protein
MNGKTIVVIEDDVLTQKLIADSLRSAGYDIATARDGATAVRIIRELQPDLLTLDVDLASTSPDDSWDGFGVVHWLRRFNQGKSQPRIVVISALEPNKIIENAAAIGAHTFLPKPFTKEKLLKVVADALKSGVGVPADCP